MFLTMLMHCFYRFLEVSSMTFLSLGNKITKTKRGQKESTKTRRFKSFFGITPQVCSIVWEKICDKAPNDFQPKHLLWGLTFLKLYTIEHDRHSTLGADEKTIRKWTWVAVSLLSNLNVVKMIACTYSAFNSYFFNIGFRLFGKIEKLVQLADKRHFARSMESTAK